MRKIISIILLSVTVLACKKDEILFDTTPSIEFVSITPSSVTEFEDEVILTILYRDGDGDLGENNPEVKGWYNKINRFLVSSLKCDTFYRCA